LGDVRVVGVDAVALERTTAAVATPTWDPQLVAADVAAAIAAALAEAAGQGPWKVDVIGDAKTLAPLATAARPLVAAGGAAPWTGRQEFLVRGADGGAAQTVFVRVTRFERAVVAVRPIERGQIISPADVELRELDGNVPSLSCRTLDSAIGREARQALRAGSVVQTSQVHAPIVVRRGETVTVAARADGIVVKTLAEARQDGGIGELVQVEAVDGRRRERFMARVTGRRQCEVYAAGVAADDFAWR
jgi:flagella basal body P-ring formation protein FlgA